MHSFIPHPPVAIDRVLDDATLVRRLVEANAPYEPVQRYFANAQEQQVLSQRAEGEGGDAPLFVAPIFRGDWAYDEPIVDGVDPILRSEVLAEAARKVFDGALVRPQMVYSNLTLPIPDYDVGHTDVPAFRGIDRTQYPIWFLVSMGRSGLFEPWRINIATAVGWWYEGEGGSFTYWPDGPDAAPRTVPPTPNTAMVGDNDFMFHRADGTGPPGTKFRPGLSLDSRLTWLGGDDWAVVDAGRELLAVSFADIRVSVSWKAQVFRDDAALKLYEDHSDDLAFDDVLDRLIADASKRGVSVERPAEPLGDVGLMAALSEAYRRTPTVQSGG